MGRPDGNQAYRKASERSELFAPGGRFASKATDALRIRFCREWAAAYQNTEEYAEGFWLEDVKGAFPSALNGTLFRYPLAAPRKSSNFSGNCWACVVVEGPVAYKILSFFAAICINT